MLRHYTLTPLDWSLTPGLYVMGGQDGLYMVLYVARPLRRIISSKHRTRKAWAALATFLPRYLDRPGKQIINRYMHVTVPMLAVNTFFHSSFSSSN